MIRTLKYTKIALFTVTWPEKHGLVIKKAIINEKLLQIVILFYYKNVLDGVSCSCYVVAGYVIPEPPFVAWSRGRMIDVPLLIGSFHSLF